MESNAKKADKTVITDQYTTFEPLFLNKKMMLYPKTHYIEENEHTEHKTVIKNPQILTPNSINMYVPVEYYGKINPKATKD